MEYSYKFRLYPTREQENLIQRTFGCTRFVYNYFLDKRIQAYKESKETLNYYACCTALTELKKTEEHSWLKEVDSIALQQSLRDLDNRPLLSVKPTLLGMRVPQRRYERLVRPKVGMPAMRHYSRQRRQRREEYPCRRTSLVRIKRTW